MGRHFNLATSNTSFNKQYESMALVLHSLIPGMTSRCLPTGYDFHSLIGHIALKEIALELTNPFLFKF